MPTMTPALARANPTSTAACADVDPELMFPLEESQRPAQRTPGELAALAVCARCAIVATCRADVLDAQMPYGVAGALTAADRREVRARRRLAPAQQAAVGGVELGAAAESDVRAEDGPREAGRVPVTSSTAPAAVASPGPTAQLPTEAGINGGAGSDVDAVIAGVLAEQARFGHGADPARVAALLTPRGAPSASRWEVALTAVVAMRLGRSPSAAARELGEQYTPVKRWRDRDRAGEALVRGPAGAGTSQLPRPSSAAAPSQTAPTGAVPTRATASEAGASEAGASEPPRRAA